MSNTVNAFIGTYTNTFSEGIYKIAIDTDTKDMRVTHTIKAPNPSYLTLSKDGKHLYAALELRELEGQWGGHVAHFKKSHDKYSLVSAMPTHGADPCHLSCSEDGKLLFVANYTEGTANAFTLDNGSLPEHSKIIVHIGHGPNQSRQDKAHVHCALPTPDGKHLALVDLGLDSVIGYPIKNGKVLNGEPSVMFRPAPGSGPRHMVFHTSGYAYLVCELNSTVYALKYSGGVLSELGCYSTLPDDFKDKSTCAAIHLSPDGKFVAVSNRGHDSIAIFRVLADGTLERTSIVATHGREPRDFAFLSGTNLMLVANQNSDKLCMFEMDYEKGEASFTGKTLDVPMPVCVLFV